MSGVKDISRDLDKLDDQLDDLEDALEPFLGNLEELSSQLPLLDKAKLFSLAAYSIESLLFCESFNLSIQAMPANTHQHHCDCKGLMLRIMPSTQNSSECSSTLPRSRLPRNQRRSAP
jgi:exosome complex protein LRP1